MIDHISVFNPVTPAQRRGKQEMDPDFEAAWQRLTYTMMRMLNGLDANLTALLHSKDLLSFDEYEKVKSKTVTSDANEVLMAAVRRRGRSGLDGLVKCLKEEEAYKELVEAIQKEWPSAPNTPVPSSPSLPKKHVLDVEDVDALFAFLKAAAPQWRNIGTRLGFPKVDLDNIVTKTGLREDAHFFQELLYRWLNWAPPDREFPCTEDLAAAIQPDYGRLALRLKQKESKFMSKEKLQCD